MRYSQFGAVGIVATYGYFFRIFAPSRVAIWGPIATNQSLSGRGCLLGVECA